MTKNTAIAREHLDARTKKFKEPNVFVRPARGWICAIRESLGMSRAQLAKRLGVSRPRVTALEQGEVKEILTLQSLKKAAEALNCTLGYVFIPNLPLDKMVEIQAHKLAAARLTTVKHTMNLEKQGIAAEKNKKLYKQLVSEILDNEIRHLWDEI